MNLQQTIDELEQEARKYQQAADALRAIQQNGDTSNGANLHPTPAKPGKAKKQAKAAKQARGAQKREVSPETRAKIAATLKARHAAKNGGAK